MFPLATSPEATAWTPRIGYSTNVHPGETLAQVYTFLRDYTIPINTIVHGKATAGLELRLGLGSAAELRKTAARAKLREFLAENRLVCFSINAFPLRDFHARRVKEQVYLPSWADPERSRATSEIARIFADLLPEGVEGSISTSGGGYRPAGHDPRIFDRMAVQYLETLATLEEIEQKTGKRIVLAVEPEPDTTFEVAHDVVWFTEWHLLPAARKLWGKKESQPGRIEERVRRYFTVNFDTCHFSVLFQDPVESLRQIWRAGLQIGKVHVTNAIRLRNPEKSPQAYAQFRAMHEERYFHQFCGRSARGESVWRGRDLDELPARLTAGNHPAVAELRTHFHVPIHMARWKSLETTRAETRKALSELLHRKLCSHLVIETYTWPLLAKEERLIRGIVSEHRWLRLVLGRHWPGSRAPSRR